MVLRLSYWRVLRRPEASRPSLASVGSTGARTGRSGAFKLANAASRIAGGSLVLMSATGTWLPTWAPRRVNLRHRSSSYRVTTESPDGQAGPMSSRRAYCAPHFRKTEIREPFQRQDTDLRRAPTFHLRFSERCDCVAPSRLGKRDVRAIVTTREAGMRWPRQRRARWVVRTNGAAADGEVVWSWRPDAGAKLRG
jgi:hypothetical protein